jgi:ribosomal protein S18 acetylase RimI-like enzyme
MNRSPRRRPVPARFRRGRLSDLSDLIAIENEVFTVDLLSRRSFRHFLTSRNAAVIVAEQSGKLAGYALVLYRPRSRIARLYSIAVGLHIGKRGVGPLLLAAAEDDARHHRCRSMRLEVHDHNTRAIARYEKSGYSLFGRRLDYYDDHATALRFEKPLIVETRRGRTDSAKKSGSRARIGFDGGQRGRNGRHSARF